jgi:pimeloyl-ACP methyl ester carboxylesterase
MRRTKAGIAYASGGSEGPLLLLLHGLGATGAVWTRLLAQYQDRWPGRWAAPDLRGHGLSLAETPYGFGVHAADMAELAAELEAPSVTVLGHSFGGVVGAALGSGWYGVTVDRVVALGVKIDWTEDEISRARAMAGRPPQVFGSAGEAADRHLKLAGLRDLVDPAEPVARAGVKVADGGWVAALDPRAFGAVGPSVETVLSRCVAPLRLAAGSADAMVGLDAMQRIDPDAVLVDGAGHNAHYERPDETWALLTGFTGR